MSTSIPQQQNTLQQPIEGTLRGIFITGLETRLETLQTDAWSDIPKATMRPEQLPYHVGMILLTSANEEALRIQREQMKASPEKPLNVLPRDQLLGSFVTLTAMMHKTPADEQSELLKQQIEGLRQHPERYVDTRIIASIGKLAHYRELPGLSQAKSENILRIVPFALAVQGLIVAKRPLPEIVPTSPDHTFPSPRNRVRNTTAVDLRAGRTQVASVQ